MNFDNIKLPHIRYISEIQSKNIDYLIAKDPGSGSSKLTKAKDLGVILLSIDELEKC